MFYGLLWHFTSIHQSLTLDISIIYYFKIFSGIRFNKYYMSTFTHHFLYIFPSSNFLKNLFKLSPEGLKYRGVGGG